MVDKIKYFAGNITWKDLSRGLMLLLLAVTTFYVTRLYNKFDALGIGQVRNTAKIAVHNTSIRLGDSERKLLFKITDNHTDKIEAIEECIIKTKERIIKLEK